MKGEERGEGRPSQKPNERFGGGGGVRGRTGDAKGQTAERGGERGQAREESG